LNSLVKFTVSSVLGLGLGVLSAQTLIDGYGDFFSKTHGPWVSWPTAGTRSSSPYVRAHYLLNNRLPVSQFEINELEARVDDKGEELDGNCTYLISGRTPKARWWSLYTFSTESEAGPAFPKRAGTNSQQIIYQPDGSFKIKLSLEPQSGNWLVPVATKDLVIVLRFYNPGRNVTDQFGFDNLPKITRGNCR